MFHFYFTANKRTISIFSSLFDIFACPHELCIRAALQVFLFPLCKGENRPGSEGALQGAPGPPSYFGILVDPCSFAGELARVVASRGSIDTVSAMKSLPCFDFFLCFFLPGQPTVLHPHYIVPHERAAYQNERLTVILVCFGISLGHCRLSPLCKCWVN